MKKKFMKKISLAVLCLVLIAQLLSVCTFAETVYYVDWELSEDTETLTGDGRTYTRYPIGFIMEPIRIYEYFDTVYVADDDGYYWDGECPVRALEPNSDIVWVRMESKSRIYVATDEAREHFDRYKSGEEQVFNLNKYGVGVNSFSYMEHQLVDLMDLADENGAKRLTVDVTELADKERYYVVARDTYLILLYNYGEIFKLDDGYYYVNYGDLENTSFDADGYLSFRRGSITLTYLDDSISAQLENRINALEPLYVERTYENDYPYLDDYYDDGGIEYSDTVFWICYVLVGFVFPIPFIVMGLCFANAKRFGKPRYWYLLSVVSGLWFLLSTILTLLIM